MIIRLSLLLLQPVAVWCVCDKEHTGHLKFELANDSKFALANLTITETFKFFNPPEYDDGQWSMGSCAQLCDAFEKCAAFDWHLQYRTCKLGSNFTIIENYEDELVENWRKLKPGEIDDPEPMKNDTCRKKSEVEKWIQVLDGSSTTRQTELLSSTTSGVDVKDPEATSSVAREESTIAEGKTEKAEKDGGTTTVFPGETSTEGMKDTTEVIHTSTNYLPTTTPGSYSFENVKNVSAEVHCEDSQCSCPQGTFIRLYHSSDSYIGHIAKFKIDEWVIYSEYDAYTTIGANVDRMECLFISGHFVKNDCRIPLVKNGIFGEKDIRCLNGMTPTVITKADCTGVSVISCEKEKGFYCGKVPAEVKKFNCKH